ncbi:Phytosulfokine [Artemisia annua]|uniref:Phytosulfokine n=1 Tax=Artemisia annua TaxID=35608 RepID=A0A2U1PWR1_ARTAN|nr:Phytosulfokine [Artemisia annua]
MSEQEPKPPNPNELISPPPVVNPPSSRMDKNLRTKKTNKSLNTKNNSTMKHVDMLSKSSDVIFRKVATRSGAKGAEDMEVGDGISEDMEVQKDVAIEGMSSEVNLGLKKNVEGSDMVNLSKEVSLDKKGNDNVSVMFPELNSVYGSKKNDGGNNNSTIGSDNPVNVNVNSVLASDISDKSCVNDKNVMEGIVDGNGSVSNGKLGNGQAMQVDSSNVTGSSSVSNGNLGNGQTMQMDSGKMDVQNTLNKDGSKVSGTVSRPLSFSNAVQGKNFGGGNKLKLIPCSKNNEGKITASMCDKAYGRASFARVLIEVDAKKGIVDSVEVWYKKLGRSMSLKVNFKNCNHRTLTEEEKLVRANVNVQKNAKVDMEPRLNDGWQTAHGKKSSNGVAMNEKSQPSPAKAADMALVLLRTMSHIVMVMKRVIVVSLTMVMVDIGLILGEVAIVIEVEVPKETQVKHIAQRNFTTKNRYAALVDEEGEDVQNELEGIKINIDVACEMGIDISNEERSKWPKELQEYYEQKCLVMGKNEKFEKLKKIVDELNNEITSRSKSIEAKVTEEANDMVAEEMESTGASRGPALKKVYSELYNSEVKQIQQLNFRKLLAEVELFIVLEQPSSEVAKTGCHFARRLWERLKIMAKLNLVSNCWPQLISSIVNIPAKNSIWSVIQRLVWGAAVYYIWQERNVRLFGGYSRNEDELFKIISDAIRLRIMGMQLKVTPDVISASKAIGMDSLVMVSYNRMVWFCPGSFPFGCGLSSNKELCTTAKVIDLDCADYVLVEFLFCYCNDKELCTTARWLDLVCADYVMEGDWIYYLIHKGLCTTAKWLGLVCADYVIGWYRMNYVLVWLYSIFIVSCFLLWTLEDWWYGLYSRNFMMVGVFTKTKRCITCMIWRVKSGRVIIGFGLIEVGLMELTGADVLYFWWSYTGWRGYHSQKILICLTIYFPITFNFCALFPWPIFFPQGFAW